MMCDRCKYRKIVERVFHIRIDWRDCSVKKCEYRKQNLNELLAARAMIEKEGAEE